MTTLRTALMNHRDILGSNFERLGRDHWTYLSYDKQSGWSVVQFKGITGFIQQILRNLFGYYSSTHWNNVLPRIRSIDKVQENLPRVFCARMDGRALRAMRKVLRVSSNDSGSSDVQRFSYHPSVAQTSIQIGVTQFSVEEGIISRAEDVEAIVVARVNYEQTAPAVGDQTLKEWHEQLIGVRESLVVGTGQLQQFGIQKVLYLFEPLYEDRIQGVRSKCRDLLTKAYECGIRSLAIPPIGIEDGMSIDDATRTIVREVIQYVSVHPEQFDRIKLLFPWKNDYLRAARVCSFEVA